MNIAQIKETMSYGPASEDAKDALAWLARHEKGFGLFIGGKFTKPRRDFVSTNPANTDELAWLTQAKTSEIAQAIASARKVQAKWEHSGGPARARVLYALARLIQKNARLFAVLETLDNGKPIRESRDIDIPLVIRHFYHHAGQAQLFEQLNPAHCAHGVCAQVIPWNFPLLMLAWKIAPALAAGNTVVLKPAEQTPLSALLFAELCTAAGVPDGVINIITGDGAVGAALVAHDDVDKVAFTGSTTVGRKIREATAGQGKALTLELGGKSAYIVFEDADLDSAVEGLVDAIWLNAGQVCCAGSRLLLQESISAQFIQKLKTRMARLRIGDPLEKTVDMGPVVSAEQCDMITQKMQTAQGEDVFAPSCDLPQKGHYFAPSLVENLDPAHPLMQEEIFGPVIVATHFRTPSEAVELANNTRYGLAASVWSENITMALDVAPKLAAGVIWVNGTNMFDAAVGFGGVRESGFGREGGAAGMLAYCKSVTDSPKILPIYAPMKGEEARISDIDQTQKLFIGGKQARPDGGYSDAVFAADGSFLGHVARANRKDIRNAAEAARAAARSFGKTTGHLRAQILYFMAENLSAQSADFENQLEKMTGKDGQAEVSAAVERLMCYGAWADKFDGGVRNVPTNALAVEVIESVGVTGVICPDAHPLLGLVSCVAPHLAMGGSVIAVASEIHPTILRSFYALLETSDVPSGVVNLLSGKHAELAPHLAGHMDVDAMWSFGAAPLSHVVEAMSITNLKRTWVNNGAKRDWYAMGQEPEFLRQASEIKSIWVPYGV